uniref:Uncharacterized protein n=1 Tax=Strongyloides stercoralis TaxID=6248 RepID=A0A0K0DTU9_STRER
MASFFIEKKEEKIQNTFINVSNVFTNIFKEKVSTIHEHEFVDKLNFKGFCIRVSINGIIDRDNFLIIKEKINNKIIYKPGILLAVGNNEKKIICFVKELVTINSLILKDKFKNETLTDSIYNLMNIVDDSGFFKKYFIVNDCYKNLNWVLNNNNIKVIKNEDSIYSKELLIKSKSQVSYICPMLHSFEHN